MPVLVIHANVTEPVLTELTTTRAPVPRVTLGATAKQVRPRTKNTALDRLSPCITELCAV